MTAEQRARELLERMGFDAAGCSAGDVVELANLIAEHAECVRDAARWRRYVLTGDANAPPTTGCAP